MPKVPELTGLMVAPAGARQGNFQYSQVNPDQTVAKTVADVGDKANALMGLQARAAKKARDDMIDTRATEAANQFYTVGTEMMVGKEGALRQTGASVVQPQDGVPFSVAWGNKLTQKAEELLSSIDDPEVRKKAQEKMAAYDRQFRAQLYNHEGVEFQDYRVSQTKADVAIKRDAIRLFGVTKESIGELHGAVLRQAEAEGLNIKDPKVAEALYADVRTQASGAVKEKVYGLLDMGDIKGAEAAYTVASVNDALTLEDRYNTKKIIGEAKDSRVVADASSAATYGIVAARSPGYVAASAAFGSAGVSPELAASLGLEVPEAAGRNPELMRSFGAQVLTQLADKYGTIEAGITAAVVGVDRMDQAIEESKDASGNIGDWASKLTPSERAAASRAVNKFTNNAGLRMAPTDTEITAALVRQGVPTRLIPDALEATKARLAMEDMRKQADQLDAVSQSLGEIANGASYGELSASVRFRMTPEQQRAARVLASRDPRKPVVGNSAERMRLENNPELLRDMSDADFAIVVRSWTTDEEYAALASRRNALRGMNSIDTDVNRSDIKAAVDAYGRQKFGPDWDENTPEMKYKRARIYDEAYTRAVEAARQTVGIGGAAKGQTTEVVDAAVRSTFDTRLNVQGGWFSNASDVAWYDLTLDDFSTEAKGVGRLLATYMFNEREPSDHMVKETIIRWAYDPKGTPPEEAMKQIRREYGDELDAVQAEFKAARGRALDDGALIRAFILKSQDDESWYRLVGREKAPRATPAQFSSDGAVVDPFTYDGFDN